LEAFFFGDFVDDVANLDFFSGRGIFVVEEELCDCGCYFRPLLDFCFHLSSTKIGTIRLPVRSILISPALSKSSNATRLHQRVIPKSSISAFVIGFEATPIPSRWNKIKPKTKEAGRQSVQAFFSHQIGTGPLTNFSTVFLPVSEAGVTSVIKFLGI
jgi:hypothetical protein